MPRHPPNALLALEIVKAPIRLPQWRLCPPCTETTRYHGVAPIPPSAPATAGHSALNTPLNATTRCRQAETCRSDTCTRSRPETHQTLIHPDKDHRAGQTPGPQLPAPASLQETRTKPLTPRRSAKTTSTPDRPNTRAQSGGGDRARTDDPLLAKQALSQLSYTPKAYRQWLPPPPQGLARTPSPQAKRQRRSAAIVPQTHQPWAREDLNLRPHAYQACALTS